MSKKKVTLAEVQTPALEKLVPDAPKSSWFLVEVLEGENPTVFSASSVDELVARLRYLADTPGSFFFVFEGVRHLATKGLYKYLVLPDRRIPLFEDNSDELDETGFVDFPALRLLHAVDNNSCDEEYSEEEGEEEGTTESLTVEETNKVLENWEEISDED